MRTAFSKAKVVDVDDIPTINFSRAWTEFYTSLKDIFRHKPPDLSKYRTKAEVLAYLERELSDISLHLTTDQDLEKQSSKLCSREKQIRELRIHGFHGAAVG
jgi:hypothetical protein